MKKNGFISKQLQKMLAPVINACLHITHSILLESLDVESWDDLINSRHKVEKYEDYEKLVLEKLKEVDING